MYVLCALICMQLTFKCNHLNVTAEAVFVTASSTQDTDAGSVQMQECLFMHSRLRISRQSNWKGCETPKALSSLIMVEESAAMKIDKHKPLHSRRKTKGY